MKATICVILTIICLGLYGQSADTLSNKSIIDLTKAKIGKATQKSMIASSICNFSVDTKSIIELKTKGVDDEVISAMIDRMNGTKQNENTQATEESNLIMRLTKEGSGIYYLLPDSTMQELDPSVFSQSKQGSFLGSALTYGLAKSKEKMSLSGSSANLQIKDVKPHFYFVFTSTDKNLNQQMPSWFDNATSPNEFILVKFSNKGKKNREIVTGSTGTYSGAVQGIDDGQKQSFKFKKIAKGIYEVSFEPSLQKGEYCFMYAGVLTSAVSPKVYDFGIE